MAGDPRHSGGKHSRLRRAQKDWVKGNRERAGRIDAEDESVQGGSSPMKPRAITIDAEGDWEKLPRGRVVNATSGRYDVLPDAGGTLILCRVKRGASSENDHSSLVAIGDYVRVQPLEEDRGLITHVEERRGHLGRNAAGREGMEHVIAANVDQVMCTIGADRPDFRRTVIDRYIVASLIGDCTPVVLVTKMDTVGGELEELLREEMAIYEQLGYQTLYMSVKTGEGMDDLRAILREKTSVLVGQSGAGKSTLINTLSGNEDRRVGVVRENDRRGMHTTIDSSMLSLKGGGYLIDTPGLREFGIWDLKPEELDGYFIEFLDHLQKCKYQPCTHTHEPHCAVIAAVESGEIDEGRYASYLNIFESLKG